MDHSCSTNYTYISCCIIIALNLIYLGFTSIKVFIEHRRRRRQRLPRRIIKMTENTNDSIPSRIATRSSTAAAAAAAAAVASITTTNSATKPTNRTTATKLGYERLAQLYPHIGDDVRLPTKWNGKDKPATLVLQQNDLVVTYKGPGKSHKDAASVRADHPIPPLSGIYYFEIQILSKGRDGYMGIGLSTSEVSLNRLPGWDKGSYGYHGDDGHSFCSSGSGIVYGPTFTTDDVVGCCVNFIDNSCFYTLNGRNLGTSFRDIPADIYPTVGLQTPNESILANFGLNPFKFDIEKYMDEYREKTRRSIIEHSFKESEVLHQSQLRRIVSTYLVHYGYCATAEQFNKNAESFYADELNSMRNRQFIQHLILEGRTTDAIEKTKELFPALLKDRNLLFLLKVRQFIEMINGTESEIVEPIMSSSVSNCSYTNGGFSSLNSQNNDKHRSTSPSSVNQRATERSSSPDRKTNESSRSRSKSPYTSVRNRQQQTNGTSETPVDSSPVLLDTNQNHGETSQETPQVVNLMDIDVNLSSSTTTNGFTHHQTEESSSNLLISNGHSSIDDNVNNQANGHSTKSTDPRDGMDQDEKIEPTVNVEMEADDSSNVQNKSMNNHDDQLLIRILQFGRDLHALKQQLSLEHGENPYHDKILQDAFSLLAYSDPKSSPLAHLLEPSQRETVSSAINSAILEAHDMPRHPALEVLVGYLNECDKLMRKNNIPDCAYIDLKRYLR